MNEKQQKKEYDFIGKKLNSLSFSIIGSQFINYFIILVSGAIGHGQSENPEVKVWRVENDKLIHTLSLSAHSLGIVSVDVSPNGKCI